MTPEQISIMLVLVCHQFHVQLSHQDYIYRTSCNKEDGHNNRVYSIYSTHVRTSIISSLNTLIMPSRSYIY